VLWRDEVVIDHGPVDVNVHLSTADRFNKAIWNRLTCLEPVAYNLVWPQAQTIERDLGNVLCSTRMPSFDFAEWKIGIPIPHSPRPSQILGRGITSVFKNGGYSPQFLLVVVKFGANLQAGNAYISSLSRDKGLSAQFRGITSFRQLALKNKGRPKSCQRDQTASMRPSRNQRP